MRKRPGVPLFYVGQPVALNLSVRWQPEDMGRRLSNMRGTVVAREETHKDERYTVEFPAAQVRLGLLSGRELTAL